MNRNTAEREVPPWAAGTAERLHELDPALTDEEIDILREYGTEHQYGAGETLWLAGEPATFLLVLEGKVEIYTRIDDVEQSIIQHGPRHYVGETISMTGGRTLVSGRSLEDVCTLELKPEDVRRVIATESELGEKLLLSFILRRMRLVAEGLADIQLVGDARGADTLELESFLSRNGIPFDTIDTADTSPELGQRMESLGLTADDLPSVVVNGNPLARPDNRTIAENLGFTVSIDCGVTYDVAVVGSGPAGMTAAVYAASEGLSVIVLEACAPGGQAASSSRIENYMGFPTGISGQALMGRGFLQAQKFGAHIAVARELQGLECGDPLHKLRIDGGDVMFAKSVVLATGAVYRRPPIEGLGDIGGVHYGASHVEGEICRGRDVAVIGGGNSAGQAAMYLSKRAQHIHMLIRGKDLTHSMSAYLIDRIERTPNITLHPHTEVDDLIGDTYLEGLTVRNNRTDERERLDISNLFIFIGAQPGTSFVGKEFALDAKGFVLTGDDLSDEHLEASGWNVERRPYLLETSCPRVFAAGDVRSGSVKRVASGVGEGSICIQFVHRLLESEQQGR